MPRSRAARQWGRQGLLLQGGAVMAMGAGGGRTKPKANTGDRSKIKSYSVGRGSWEAAAAGRPSVRSTRPPGARDRRVACGDGNWGLCLVTRLVSCDRSADPPHPA